MLPAVDSCHAKFQVQTSLPETRSEGSTDSFSTILTDRSQGRGFLPDLSVTQSMKQHSAGSSRSFCRDSWKGRSISEVGVAPARLGADHVDDSGFGEHRSANLFTLFL